MSKFYRIGENLNVVTKVYGQAMKERNPKPLQEVALKEAEAGVDFIDVNIGPARKGGEELMEWIVKTIQAVVPNVPLALDTSNIAAMEAGLKVHKGRALINSIMARPERMDGMMPLVKKYDADMIGLMWGPEGMPRDENERAMHAVNLMMAANDLGIPNQRLWVDPIVSPVSVEINQVKACVTFMQTLQDLVPGCKSTVGLSNISNGAPDHLRHWLNKTYAIMLSRYGCHSAIVDAFDEDLLAIAKGQKKEVVELVHKVMDGAAVDPKALNPELLKYYRSAKVLVGETLYSASWLEG